jgi:hypothetical protein
MKLTIVNGDKRVVMCVREGATGKCNILNDLGLCSVDYKEIAPRETRARIDDACSICFETLNTLCHKRRLSCNHTFHKKCIDKWAKDNLNCPVCRKDMYAK